MFDRIADLAQQLSAATISPDEIDHAAIALQALTTILVQRDVRASMARWETMVNERGQRVKRLRPDNEPTQEEVEIEERNRAEMLAARQAPAAGIWDPESTVGSAGKAMSKAEYRSYLKNTGREEVTGYDVRNGLTAGTGKGESAKYTQEQVKVLIERAIAHGKQTGQITSNNEVIPNAPLIPLPVEERPPPQARPPTQFDDVEIQEIPLSERKSVDTSRLQQNLMDMAFKRALDGTNGR
ncbi:MAG: hypothetical protein NUW21_04545 [Elusimicrobia bacterium]|nr:hypothetical protein [Elusimicrobiota bacterium]